MDAAVAGGALLPLEIRTNAVIEAEQESMLARSQEMRGVQSEALAPARPKLDRRPTAGTLAAQMRKASAADERKNTAQIDHRGDFAHKPYWTLARCLVDDDIITWDD